jgi:hypothetical protein
MIAIKWLKDKEQTMIYKTIHRKLTIGQHEPHKNKGELEILWKGLQFLSTNDTLYM